MNILVTGGGGFVGSALIKELSKENHSILSIDDYSASNGTNHIRSPRVEYHRCSTTRMLDDAMCCKFNPDVVYHLGEYSRIVQSFDDIRECHQSNSSGTFNVLEYCREKQAKLIYGGSSSKFGNNGDDENLSPYAWMKATIVGANQQLLQVVGAGLCYCLFLQRLWQRSNKQRSYGDCYWHVSRTI